MISQNQAQIARLNKQINEQLRSERDPAEFAALVEEFNRLLEQGEKELAARATLPRKSA